MIFTEEDVHNRYGKLLLKFYIAEGVVNKHEIFLASAECRPETILQVCVTFRRNVLIFFSKCCSVILAVCSQHTQP